MRKKTRHQWILWSSQLLTTGHVVPTTDHVMPMTGHVMPTTGHVMPTTGHVMPTADQHRSVDAQSCPGSGLATGKLHVTFGTDSAEPLTWSHPAAGVSPRRMMSLPVAIPGATTATAAAFRRGADARSTNSSLEAKHAFASGEALLL